MDRCPHQSIALSQKIWFLNSKESIFWGRRAFVLLRVYTGDARNQCYKKNRLLHVDLSFGLTYSSDVFLISKA
jgi:hypothetical protein